MAKDGNAYHNAITLQPLAERIEFIKKALTEDPKYSGWDSQVLKTVQCDDIRPGRIEYSVTITPAMCNKGNSLHGGCASTLLDNLTSSTFVTRAGDVYVDTGSVTRTLTITFHRPVPVGTKVRIICEVVNIGRNFAHCKGQIELPDGKVAITCVHDRAMVNRAKL